MTGIAPPVDALVSYHYFRSDEAMAALVDSGKFRLIGDSGAFSALTQGSPIKLPDFAGWCRQWGPHLDWLAALDVIGDPAASLANWRELRDRHGLATVPTLHVTTDPRWMDYYVRDGVDFFGLGGMVRRAIPALPWMVKVFRYARDRHPHVRFHLWGVNNRQVLDNLPAYSADSSDVHSGARFGSLRLFDPRTGKRNIIFMRGNEPYQWSSFLREVYGVAPAQVERGSSANTALTLRLHIRSFQLYSAWLQRRHQVPAPKTIRSTTVPGTRVHVVLSGGEGPRILEGTP